MEARSLIWLAYAFLVHRCFPWRLSPKFCNSVWSGISKVMVVEQRKVCVRSGWQLFLSVDRWHWRWCYSPEPAYWYTVSRTLWTAQPEYAILRTYWPDRSDDPLLNTRGRQAAFNTSTS